MMAGSQRRRGLYRGRGFLNLSKEVMVIPRNLNDPNGFYSLLGVSTWASEDEIRKGYRSMSKRYHPDGMIPDQEKFLRISYAHRVLTEHRAEYNNLPPGVRWREEGEEGMDQQKADSILAGTQPEDTPEGYSYYYLHGENYELAQEWYEALLVELPQWGYAGRVAIKLGDRLDVRGRKIEVPYHRPTSVALFLLGVKTMSPSRNPNA